MHRPLIWYSAAFAVGCGVALAGIAPLSLYITAPIVLIAILLGWRIEVLRPVGILLVGLLVGMNYTSSFHALRTEPLAQLSGMSKRMTVTATAFPNQYDDRQRVEVRVQGEKLGRDRDFKTLLYLPLTEEEIAPGDSITGKVEFYISGTTEGFDREIYYRAKGYPVLASISKESTVTIESPAKRPLTYYPKLLAKKMQEVFQAVGIERHAAFWAALTTGDRTALTTADTDHLRKAGLSHIIALSGLHVGFLISLLLLVFGKRIGTAFGIPVLIAFYLMVGWSPSVLRACIMYGIILLSFWLKTQSDSLNALFAALLVILLLLPDALLSVSLQLSFASTFGILVLSPRLYEALKPPKKFHKWGKRIWYVLTGTVICTICSTILTAPILLYHFGYISAYAIAANFLALWAVSLLFPLVFLGGIAGIFSIKMAIIMLTPAGWLTNYILWITDEISALPYGILYCEDKLDLWLTAAVCVLAVILLCKASKYICAASIPLLIALLVGMSIWRGIQAEDDLRISVLSEGGGQAILVSSGEQTALIDCSGSSYHNAAEDVEQYLDWHGISSIDCMIITSVDTTHARNAVELLYNIPVQKIILPEKSREKTEIYPALMQCLEQKNIPTEKLAPETETAVGDVSLGLSVLGGVERKLAVRIQSQDQNILTVHALTQNMLLALTEKQSLCCDTLLVSGGFSEDSDEMTELLNRIQPKEIILESGWTSIDNYDDIPVTNTYYVGQIDRKTIR